MLYIAQEPNEKLQLWMDSSDAIKRAVIKILGAVVCEITTVKTARFQQMSVADHRERSNMFWHAAKGHNIVPQAKNGQHVEVRGRSGYPHCHTDKELQHQRHDGTPC
jgi:hypothetical protein